MENAPGSSNYTLPPSLMPPDEHPPLRQMTPEGNYTWHPSLMSRTPEGKPINHCRLKVIKKSHLKNLRRKPQKHDKHSFRQYAIPFENLPILEAGLAEKNLRIYTGESLKLSELSDKDLDRHNRLVAHRKKCRRCPGLNHAAYPPEGKCLICSLDEHTSWDCPYAVEIPTKNAIVSAADIVCKVCDGLFSAGHCCNQVLGRARLIFCGNCRKFGEHCKQQCPHPLPYFQRWYIDQCIPQPFPEDQKRNEEEIK